MLCKIIQRPLRFRNEMYVVGFNLKWQHRHIFHNYVKSLFCLLLAERVKGLLPFRCVCTYGSAVLIADLDTQQEK